MMHKCYSTATLEVIVKKSNVPRLAPHSPASSADCRTEGGSDTTSGTATRDVVF